MPYRLIFSITLITLLSAFSTSCTTVRISTQGINSAVQKLDETNRKTVFLSVTEEGNLSSAGHQYLFFIVPFGKVVIDSPTASVFNEAQTRLAIAGFKIKDEHAALNRLKLKIRELQLTAYDFFFIRQIYCNLEIEGEFLDSSRQKRLLLRGHGVKSSYKFIAFKPQLEHVFSQCLGEAVNQVLYGLY